MTTHQDSSSGHPEPVFIIGGSRTGSEVTKSVLVTHSPVDMVPEMWLLCPPWLHRDFTRSLKREFDRGYRYREIAPIVDAMYSGKLFGTFWQRIGERIERADLEAALERNERSLKGILTAVLETHMRAMGKHVPGAKFPVHYSRAPLLLRWFPRCRIIHSIRDPRAIYASQSAKHDRAGDARWPGARSAAAQFAHVALQFWWSTRVHERLGKDPRYFVSRYEDLVTRPREHLSHLCTFLEIPFEEGMTSPTKGRDSSFSGRSEEAGFYARSIDEWRRRVKPGTVRALERLLARELSVMGYGANPARPD